MKYALKELLKDKTADEILHLTVCEPAMGSAAFLNETVNQLSKAYLDKKQKELNQTISHEDYPRELQKVKMYIADNNVHGVDLNPVAVELAEVSLWLNTIYKGAFVPWFGMQLVCGNSLVGARRQVFDSHLLKKGKRTDPVWLDEVPKRVKPGEKRDPDTVYHFLLPDKSMANYTDNVVKKLAGDQIKEINDWRKDFIKPLSKSEIDQLKKLSDAADKLWASHVEMQRGIDSRTTDPLKIFGQKEPDKKLVKTTTEFKDSVLEKEMFSQNVRNSSPYRRLKLVMDYWCALWFWPIEKSGLLPSRAEYLFDLTLILEGNLFDLGQESDEQLDLFPSTQPKQMSLNMIDELGFVDVDKLCCENNRLNLVHELGERYRFLHWELEFADLFESQGGFDLVIGNPPWIKMTWNEGGIIGDKKPLFVFRKFSASKLSEVRSDIIEQKEFFDEYFLAYEEADGILRFLNSDHNYPLIKGVQTNLYKCFIICSFSVVNNYGSIAMIHQPGVYDDPKGGKLRSEIYKRLRLMARFQNWLQLFSIMVTKEYCLTVLGAQKESSEIKFDMISNLLHPKTLTQSYNHEGTGAIPGIKSDDGEWNLKGHQSRIIKVTRSTLSIYSNLYDPPGTHDIEARLPVIHSTEIGFLLQKISTAQRRLRDLKENFFSTRQWDETGAVKNGTIRRETRFSSEANEFVLSGPHIYVATPYYKTPNKGCRNPRDYSPIDLTLISKDYLPRTNYVPACSTEKYQSRIPTWKGSPCINNYRLAFRAMLSPTGERTLISCIIPPLFSHINGIHSYCIEPLDDFLCFAGLTFTLPYDLFIKSSAKSNLHELPTLLPIVDSTFYNPIISRTLRLNCLTSHYASLWEKAFNEDVNQDSFTKK
ncbi:MAG: hypothetical protein HQK65_18385 [Desulfamplus sp.]|nr:hypothetical protein [Desulfamplus sp.]